MSVMTTGRPGGLARVTALPRPRTDEDNGTTAGVSGPDRWQGGQQRSDAVGEPGRPGQAPLAAAAQLAGEARQLPGQRRVAAFRRVTRHRRVREFRQVREVQVAREFRVVREAAPGGTRAGAGNQTAVGSRIDAGNRIAGGVPGRAGRPPARPGGIRLTRRGRVVVATLLTLATLLVMALVWLTVAARAQATNSGPPPGAVYRNLTSVVVHPGQSLWSIASQVQPSADPRIVMQEIVDLNALHGTSLVPGQRLWVPRG